MNDLNNLDDLNVFGLLGPKRHQHLYYLTDLNAGWFSAFKYFKCVGPWGPREPEIFKSLKLFKSFKQFRSVWAFQSDLNDLNDLNISNDLNVSGLLGPKRPQH